MIMQILEAGGFPIMYDSLKLPDEDNPKGYYELERGKILNQLLDKKFNPKLYYNTAIKITSYGIYLLPPGNYKIIYIERNLEEIYYSQQKKIERQKNLTDIYKYENPITKGRIIETFGRLNENTKSTMDKRDDIKYILLNHKNFFTNPIEEIQKISDFVGGIDIEEAMKVIDSSLYRNRNG